MYLNPRLFILGWGIFLGYQIHKNEVDKKVGRIIREAYDGIARHTASVMIEEATVRSIKASDAPKA